MTSNRILIKKSKVSLSQPPRVIGRGAMGEVYLANYQGRNVVVKKSQRDIDILLKEYSNYFKLQNHNNILKFHGVIRDDRYSFSLVLEYAPHGNLSSYLKTHTVGWNAKARICRDVALGLMYCHDNNVLHFDLKPENVLLDKDLVPKLADFGISKTKSQMVLDHGKAGGTLNYVAPERVCIDLKMREFFEKHPKLSDIYSYGLILWSVAKDGEHPYEGIGDDEIREQKRSSHSIHRLLDQLPADTPQIYNQLIYDMTTYNPSERRQLTFAVLELESLFDDDDDDDDHQVNSKYYGDSLPLDDLDSSDDDRDTSSNPVSTVTTIESERSTLASDVEINDYNEKSETTSSYKIQNRPLSIESNVYRLLVAKSSSMSSNDGVPPPNLPSNDNNVNGNKILDRSLVTSPSPISSNGDRNLVGVEIPSPSLDSISNYSLNKRDSDIKTLVGSPTNIKSPPFEEIPKISDADQELMDGVNSIFENWEKYTDDVMRRKLENLCYDRKIKAKDLFAVFENNPSKSADYYFAMGFMNEHAFGKPKDPKAAFEYYSKAAELDHPRGLVFIGWCYYKGMGTPKDPQKAFDSFQRAAENGCISAHNNVGWCYDIGFGTYTDAYKAFECFKASAEKGYATAQCRVGVCYEYGRGTIKDLERALEWYTKAANNGHETAKRRVSELSKLIRRDGRRRSFLSSLLNIFHD